MLSILTAIFNIVAVGGMCWVAFRQSEQIKDLTDKLDQAELHIFFLESECEQQSSLAWNRLSESEKDAAIKMA